MALVLLGAPQPEHTVAGDLVETRRARFASQAEQIAFLRRTVDIYRGAAAIRARAREIVFRLNNCTPRNEAQYAIAIGKWVQQRITYVKELPEVFQDPLTTIAMGYGDCDDSSPLVGSLIESVGVPCELVGLEWDAPPGSRVERAYQHIFPRAVIGGRWTLPLDTTLERPIEQLTDPIKLALERGLRLRVLVAR